MSNSSFDQQINRYNTYSMKWDYTERIFGSEVLPLWVADMDFACPQAVVEGIKARLNHPIFGYTMPSESMWQAIISWFKKRHNFNIKRDWLTFSPDVVTGFNIAINAYSNPGDKIIVQPPVYHPFFHTIQNNGRQLVENPLIRNGDEYKMDLKDLKRKIDRRVKMLILCSPHNPVGRVWRKEELQELADFCYENEIILLSDEVWADFVFPGHQHHPVLEIDQKYQANTIALLAPSKTFNLAGLLTAAAVIPNQRLREMFEVVKENSGTARGNLFGGIATEQAYQRGEPWLEELLEYLQGNLKFLTDFVNNNLSGIKVVPPQGTYLVWLDCRDLGKEAAELSDFFVKQAKVGLNRGDMFGKEGAGYMRINIGCPRETLEKALLQIEAALKA